MLDLIKTASELSLMGTMVNLNVNMWSGILPRKQEWGDRQVKVLPEDLHTAFGDIKNKIIENLSSHSIPCEDGFFIPDFSFSDWITTHNEYAEMYYKARGMIMLYGDDLRESAKSVAAVTYTEAWKKRHPLEEFPPPSGKFQASTLAASMIPSREDFYDLYKIERRFNQHSFCFISSNFKNLPIEEGEKREMAWLVINDLVAKNAKRLADCLNNIVSNVKLHGNKSRYTFTCAKLFLDTDIFPYSCLRNKVQTLMDYIRSKTFNEIDQKEFNLVFEEARAMANKFSSVSGIMEFLK